MKKIAFLLVVLAGLMLIASAALAGVDTNILENSSFDQGRTGWEASDSVFFSTDQGITKWEQPSVAYDPAGAAGEGGYLRQVVDCRLSPYWVEGGNQLIGQLDFWMYSTGTGSLKVGFGWWDDINRSKPMPGTNPDHYVVLSPTYSSLNTWSQVSLPYEWTSAVGNNNPRWVAVEFYFMDVFGPNNEAGVDEIVFTSRSVVPEPSSLAVMASGLFGIFGFALRKRSIS